MISEFSLGIGIAVLAVGTYLIRLAGPLLRNRLTVSATAEKLMDRATVVLLVAVALTGAVFAGHDFAGWARPAGVAVGVLAAVLRAPIAVVVILAAATAAGLRALGLP
ncbi:MULTISPECIES: AzlD domain-containing protein [Gordonia]|uniref:AzlD domain-containing protein n=1 Tax=Gordonia amicalis TaxID=89053 RepID=A0ABU4DIH1_9ACTN|nr:MULTISPECIES: AzlD domain-containing protein [Gordonia]ATD70036.1 branched-chain amino acid transporter [Gordonia sp. 1D]MBA5849337.1 AzlD domain-containing protein [Gordonia amicalis]MDJ0454920.1 AzlD domain-containing protein [Gordonia amicalis]MDV6309545.1 AzlD domain-containing protein [Gordonia amicalis]MDV7078197.1 AzlD domain-containing protein [Gordonia amicalis]